ncbi:sensor histidine kinase [Winogradskyella vincentii]|uniref:histidine kinase n=1 Tax=Winogradskyella vincentii TaxID=2877122 RepID=A0ABS7Y444_9FLAO|nr:PAS domain-containing sensor histidine kinase [Winogradskyella vincentii]MCA0154115.1 PAS domain S-box protein [Winogradskyella vincentii]
MLRQDQEIFNILLETVSEAVVIVNQDQKIVEVNRSAEVIFGYDNEEIKGKPLNVLMPSNYHDSHKVHFKNFIEQMGNKKMAKSMDVFGLNKLGDIIPIEVQLNPFKIYDKTYVMALIKDVTKQKETELDYMLRSKALESASNGIIITDALRPDNPIIYCNKAFIKLTGYSNKEVVHKNCRFLQGEDREQKELDKLRRAIKNGKSCLVTLRNYRKDGSLFWNDLYITPITNNDGIITNYIGIQNDVTERVKSEQERSHFATIFNESLNEIYVFDAKTLLFLSANTGALKNLGYSEDELKKMTPFDLKNEVDEESYRKAYFDPLTTKATEKVEYETIHVRKDGSIYPVNVHLQLSYLSGKPVLVAIVLDITEQKNYLQKLENTVKERTEQLRIALSKEKELNELKTKFLSLVSHEFKTPLSGISTSVMLLEKYQKETEQKKREKHLNTIKEKVQYLNAILNDFLSIERLESGTVNYKISDFNLSKVINEVVYNANMLLKEGQHIKYPINIDHMTMRQDERILELILSNVVLNAIKYSAENTCIDITIEQNKNNTKIRVKDEGVGIPKEDLENVFTRYFRAENVVNIRGTGIGLNIAKTHAENLGGEITLQSEENKGTTVTINIPSRYDS